MLGFGTLGQVPLGAVAGRGTAAANPPPYRSPGRTASAATVVALWQPPDPQPHIGGHQPLAPRRLPPAIVAVPENDPPFTGRSAALGGRALSAWLAVPDPWTFTYAGAGQPYGPRRLSPGIPGQSVELPPFLHRSRTQAFVQLAAAMAAPPVLPFPESWQFAGIRQPAMGRQLSPGIPGQSADPPPLASPAHRAGQKTVLAIAQPDPWTFTYAGGWQPYGPRKLSPGTPGQSIDQPHFGRVRKIGEMSLSIEAWQPPPPMPHFPRYPVKFIASFSMLIVIG